MQLLQVLRDSGTVWALDSAALSISDNLDLRIRVILAKWHPTGNEQTFISKRHGGNEWYFRTADLTGRLQFGWFDAAGVETAETADADVPFEDGVTGWVRVRRSGTSVTFYTSDDDTNDHTAVSWTQLGNVQTTPAGSIRSNVATALTVGSAFAFDGGSVIDGLVLTAVIVSNVTTVASPDFTDPDQWTVGDGRDATGVDAQGNIWNLYDATIIGDNIEGASVRVQAAFGETLGSINDEAVSFLDWTDITNDVESISTNRGRNYDLDRFDAGTATFQLDNQHGWYHSNNTASPYYPNIRPMVPIRVRAIVDGTIYPIWYGYVDRWPANFPGNSESKVRVDATDLFRSLSLADASQEDRAALVTSLDPVAWWRFNDDTDSSPSGTHDLTITGATTGNEGAWTQDEAGSFDGVDDFASVANEADVELLQDMSIEMWFRPERSVTPTETTFNTDDTWTAPANVTSVQVECWGPGGGGEAGDATTEPMGLPGGPSGAGGGGGAYARSTVPVVPGEDYTINIGTVGAAGTGSGGNGGDATSTIFGDNLVHADGGYGGANQVGGMGGQATLSAGTKRSSGGRGGDGKLDGMPGDESGGGGGGGGGSGGFGSFGVGGTGGAGQESTGTAGGVGGAGGAGLGAAGGTGGAASGTNGSTGTAPGGGGGGGGASGAGDGNGAAGAAGRIKLTYAVQDNMTPFSVRGTTFLYHFHWDGTLLRFGPANNAASSYVIGEAAADEWHHVVVTVDWSGGSRLIKGYLDGELTLDVSTGFQPASETRAVAVGRRAQDNDQYYKGDISEIVIYDTVLTPQDAAGLYAAQLEGYATEPTGDRIEYVLGTAEVGVGTEITEVDLDEGQTIISGPNSPTDVSALEAIQIAADTEFGQFFIGKDGVPVFHDRYHRTVDQASPLATLDQTDYETITLLGKDELRIYNDIRVDTSDVSDPFIAVDPVSKAEYGRRTLPVTIYPDDQNEGADIATLLLSRLKDPKDEVDEIPFRFYEGVTDFDKLLSGEIGNRYNIEVPLEGDDLDIDVFVERISHTIDLSGIWRMVWGVSVADEAQSFWLLGVAGFGELDQTTVLGF